jgi:hypothetical protein
VLWRSARLAAWISASILFVSHLQARSCRLRTRLVERAAETLSHPLAGLCLLESAERASVAAEGATLLEKVLMHL